MKPYLLSEVNWEMLKDFRYDLAILPWGATEAHNYHLPYGTDNFESSSIAEYSAKKAWDKGGKIVVLPNIPYGVNTGQSDIYLDMNIMPSTQLSIIRDLLTVLSRQGIKKFLILNSHGGNDFKWMLRELGLEFPDMLLLSCDWFKSIPKTKFFSNTGDHADEMETSLIMHLYPDLVLPLDQAGEGKEIYSKIKGIREGWAWSERKWSKVTKDTGIGNPKEASAEKGKDCFEEVTTKISDLIMDILKVKGNDHYE
ncbi:creatininase family protein [Belliella marina]|uniref:Creatininase family protein n=1 Tax=Belliella marina TaxID=1644146 RepID=A0ABW4VPM6_9BACT